MLIVNCLVVAAIELVPRFYVGSTLLVLFAFAIVLIMFVNHMLVSLLVNILRLLSKSTVIPYI